MRKVNQENFNKLLDFLIKLPPDEFNYKRIKSHCGTTRCALGWMDVIFKQPTYDEYHSYFQDAKVHFNMSYNLVSMLFQGVSILTDNSLIEDETGMKRLLETASLAEVIDNMKLFLKLLNEGLIPHHE